jgi:hypothetical protein
MAKVIIITSREIDDYIIDKKNHLDYSQEYQKSFKKGSGIFDQITDDTPLTDNIGIDEICVHIHADKSDNIFIPGVFKFELGEEIIYFAHEYPYHEHSPKDKYQYLEGLFETIHSDLDGNLSGYTIEVFSHDADWCYASGQLQKNQKSAIIHECNTCHWNYLKSFLLVSEIYLFEHAEYDYYYIEVKNLIKRLFNLN